MVVSEHIVIIELTMITSFTIKCELSTPSPLSRQLLLIVDALLLVSLALISLGSCFFGSSHIRPVLKANERSLHEFLKQCVDQVPDLSHFVLFCVAVQLANQC